MERKNNFREFKTSSGKLVLAGKNAENNEELMKQVEEKFKDQVAVLFYDVWTPEGQPYGQQYGIRAIPTQVFLDSGGKEYYRHEGFFPYEELVKVLEQKGVK